MLLKKFAVFVFWLLVGVAALSPFTELEPVKQLDSLEDWQKPGRITALSQADQKKVLQRLAYTQPLPCKIPLPDFNQISNTTEKNGNFLVT